jgi:tetratricopeptide (TPR) repeat protein
LPLQAGSEFALVTDKLDPALKLSGQPVKRGTMAHEHIVYMMLVDSAAQAGDEAAIRRFAPQLEELATRDDHQPYLAIAHRAWGISHRLAGEFPAAQDRLDQALDLFEELELGWQVGRTLNELGELALAKSENDAAGDYFARALASFEQMDAASDISRTNARMKSLN